MSLLQAFCVVGSFFHNNFIPSGFALGGGTYSPSLALTPFMYIQTADDNLLQKPKVQLIAAKMR
jgi:hypothetical protein